MKLKNQRIKDAFRLSNPRLRYGLPAISAGVALDCISKYVAVNTLVEDAPVSLIPGALHLHLVYNAGGFLGIPQAVAASYTPLLLTFGVVVLLVVFLTFICYVPLSRVSHRASLLVISGGTANLFERFLHDGRVTDFVQISIGPLSSGIFNIADILILCGSFILGSQFVKSLG